MCNGKMIQEDHYLGALQRPGNKLPPYKCRIHLCGCKQPRSFSTPSILTKEALFRPSSLKARAIWRSL